MEFLGMTIDPQFILPVGRVSTEIGLLGLDQSDSTYGDLIIGSTFWFINKPESNFYVGFTPWIQFPTGDYDENNGVASSALASNRYTFTTQIGIEKGLPGGFHFTEIFETNFHTGNDEWISVAGPTAGTGVKVDEDRDVLFLSQMALSYNFTPATFVNVKWRYLFGGRTEENGINIDNEQNTHRINFGIMHNLTPADQIMVEYQRDIEVENGYEQEGFWLRYVHGWAF